MKVNSNVLIIKLAALMGCSLYGRSHDILFNLQILGKGEVMYDNG